MRRGARGAAPQRTPPLGEQRERARRPMTNPPEVRSLLTRPSADSHTSGDPAVDGPQRTVRGPAGWRRRPARRSRRPSRSGSTELDPCGPQPRRRRLRTGAPSLCRRERRPKKAHLTGVQSSPRAGRFTTPLRRCHDQVSSTRAPTHGPSLTASPGTRHSATRPHVEDCLARLRAAVVQPDEPAQVMHGDLTTNVLTVPGRRPSIIDFSP